MQDNQIEILSTRPLPANVVEDAKQQGILIDEISFIQTEPIQTIEVQQEIEQAFLQIATIVFTSMNAVQAVADELQDQQPDWSIYCIGHTTEKLVKKYFGEHSIAGTADNAAELAELIAAEDGTDEVIFFCGDQRRDELPSILEQNDITVNEIIVYQTITVPYKLKKNYNAVLFFSPSAVKSFFSVNKLNDETVVFVIGETTAKSATSFTKNKIVISNTPGKEQLAQQAISYFRSEKN